VPVGTKEPSPNYPSKAKPMENFGSDLKKKHQKRTAVLGEKRLGRTPHLAVRIKA